jgi:gliding motility-associated protein GldL
MNVISIIAGSIFGAGLLTALGYSIHSSKKMMTKRSSTSSQSLTNESSSLLNIDEMLKTAKVDQNLLDNLGKGLTNLAGSASQINDVLTAAAASKEYAKNIRAASTQLAAMNMSYSAAFAAVKAMSEDTKDSSEYRRQIEAVTKSLSSLNTIYEIELKDADTPYIKNMNKFYESLSIAMQSLAKVGENTKLNSELSKLSADLEQLKKTNEILVANKGA